MISHTKTNDETDSPATTDAVTLRVAAPSPRRASSSIEVIRVSKSFEANRVLNHLNVSLVAGEFVAVIGRSGCGKSTLLRLLAGLDVPTEGTVLIDGVPLRGLNRRSRVMFQDARLMPWMRVAENVALGLESRDRRGRAMRALADVGLADRAGDWPAILSGGQRQRVALARALASEPGILLLDEPLGALDALTRIEMQTLIERIWRERGFTALLITHDVEEAVALADRVILIEEGAVALDMRVDLRRPRDHADHRFTDIRETVLSRIMGS